MDDRLKAAEEAMKTALARNGLNGSGERLIEGLDYGALVRAVLETFREPSSSMIEAASRVHELEGDRIDITPEIPAIWQAMVDAALRSGSRTQEDGMGVDERASSHGQRL